MKKHKNRIVAGTILVFLLFSFPAIAEDVTLNPIPPTTAGSFQQISWSSTGVFEPNASLELFNNGILNRTIVSETPLDIGSYYWAIPLSLQGLYQINITATTTIGQVLTNTTDINITTPSTDGCKYCHTTTGTNNSGVFDNTLGSVTTRHHSLVQASVINPMTNLPYACADCHPANQSGINGILIDRYCLDCHNGTPFWANPSKINPGEPHVNIAQPRPVINSVSLSTYTPNTGDNILVTVNVTDGIQITSVTANGVSLTKQYDNDKIWNGNITAIDGTHSVNVSVIDSAGHITWNNSTSYTATTPNPVINSVSLSTYTPNTGDNILVSVNVTDIDGIQITSVMANGVSLTKQYNSDIWNGNITAINGTNSVNVSATDSASYITWDNSTSYTATPNPVINGVSLSTYTPNTGDNILVSVNVTDGIPITNVTANGVSLTKQYNSDIWNGNITAIDGTHSVNVSATDSLTIIWDNSTIYSATTPNINVTRPKTGDKWLRGTTQSINWTYVGNLGNYATVELLQQGNVNQRWTNVSQSNGVGSLIWSIPQNFMSSTYQIRVSAGGYSNTTGNFSIVKR